ncbi:YybH family protein [Calycomorphotria hydatis]|uniref:SnoaL-like domain protein n=1 Tax=Calycomorphotria hydatis TaxID=2528027 RepID=A0A517T486_9PLAN|nr:SgcJ/EcaC family oxidoreductase [Calycomorphotria hydatis]QDT63178.1 SnoaL-like domain protein [Calycomorphotria hydatis]
MRSRQIGVLGLAAVCGLWMAAEKCPADETDAVQAGVQQYLDAFNGHDAAKAASFWTENAEYVGPSGDMVDGREAIQKAYEDLFESTPNVKLTVDVLAIRQIAPSVILEQGSAVLFDGEEQLIDTTYKATHVKTADGWKMNSVKELLANPEESNYEQMKPLGWMVGNWVDDNEGIQIELTCIWSKNKSFLLRKFEVINDGVLEMDGTQIIGWDAERKQIRSWVFDSEGGIGEGTWEEKDGRWIVRVKQTMRDGSTATSINVMEPVDEDAFTWQSTGRIVGGTPLPDIAPGYVIRK